MILVFSFYISGLIEDKIGFNLRGNSMRKIFLGTIICILVFASLGIGQKLSARQKAIADARQAEVEATFDRLIEGIRQVDADKVMSVYDKSNRTLFFNYNGSATLGWDNMEKNRKASYADRKNVSLEITGLRIELLSPTSAYITCKWKQTQEYKGEIEQSTGRMSLVLKRKGKEWKVLHLHTSPDSFPSEVVIPASEKPNTDSA